MGAGSLVAVHERVVFHQAVSETGGLLLQGRIGTGSRKTLKGRAEGGLQKPFVPQPGAAAGGLNQLLMEQLHLPLVEKLHLASSS